MKHRVLVAMVAVTVLAVAAFGVPLAAAVQRLYRNQALLRLEEEAEQAATQVPGSFATSGDPPELPAPRPGTQLALYGADGRRVLGTGPDRGDGPVRGALGGRVTRGAARGRLLVAVPVASEERVVAAVRATAGEDGVTDRVQAAWLTMAALAVAAVAAAAVVAGWQARRLSHPVDALAQAAGRLGEGDFTSRTSRSGMAEVDAVADTLDATAERLGRLLARERALTADASHQLRTPLAGLRLRLEAAQVTPGADRDKAIVDALREVGRLEATVEELLLLARDPGPTREPLDVPRLLAEVEREWHERLAVAGRPLRVDVEPALPPVRASAPAVRQVLNVLIANAAEHGRGTVRLSARAAPGGLAVEVRDDGPGISGDPERLFDRRVGTAPGHGIGLALARSLAEAEGGRLLLTRARPAVFTMLLPSPRH